MVARDWAPLRLSPVLKDKVWGGTRLAGLLGRGSPTGRRIGEAWVVWDQLTVEGGEFSGLKLADLVSRYPLAILGSRFAGQTPTFPLLVKLIDTQEILSVQVHPDDAYAQEREGQPFGKAEAWVVLDAAPGARLYHGVKRAISRAEAERAIAQGTFQEMLDEVEVTAGDVILNSPGTVHALGPGLLLYEIQQSSDLTYRLYDWNRGDPARPLHLDKSLDVAHLAPYASHKLEPVEVEEQGGRRSILCACRRFAVEWLRVETSAAERPLGVCFHVLTVVAGSGTLHSTGPGRDGIPLQVGQSLLVPAVVQEYHLRAGSEPLALIKGYVPDLDGGLVAPLWGREVAEARIAQQGGDCRWSTLRP